MTTIYSPDKSYTNIAVPTGHVGSAASRMVIVQTILSNTLVRPPGPFHQLEGSDQPFFQTYFIPCICAIASIVLVSLQVWLFKRRHGQSPNNDQADFQVYQHNRKTIFVWKAIRLISCAALTVFAITIAFSGPGQTCLSEHCTSVATLYPFLFYAYSALLAITSLFASRQMQLTVNSHLVVLLLVAFGVQAWNYLVPFALSNKDPNKLLYGWPIWTHISLLGLAAVVIPLCVPRLYIPLDPKNPSPPNPEQTASLISLMTYTYLNPIIFAAYRAPKLEYDQLPPLADYDHAAVLRQRGLDAIDPMNTERNKNQHIFWGLMRIFWREYSLMGFLAVTQATMELSGPLAIRFLLKYLDNPSEPGYFRPWVWVIWLFFGPVIGSLAMQWYLFLTSSCFVRAEAILTQVIFEHSLRLRMVTEAANKVSGTNDMASELERPVTESEEADGSESATVAASADSAGAKGNEQADDSGSNIVGKINNLMSTVRHLSTYFSDLGNILEGRDFLFLVTYAPFEIVCSAILLYWILGWSAVVGMVCMVLFFPLPRKVAQLVNGIQTDARVQGITEGELLAVYSYRRLLTICAPPLHDTVMSVIRMIKLFGWENKIKAQVDAKREDELHWYKKKRVLRANETLTSLCSYTLPMIVMMITFACHTLVFKHTLDASMVFSSIGVFELLRNQLHFVFSEITTAVQAKVSLDRVDDFLKNSELLDAYARNTVGTSVESTGPHSSAIGFHNATFTWTKRPTLASTSSTRNFKLVIDQELLFHRGKINMIVGPTGCGKTSLLLALLGEMHFTPDSSDSWFALPKEGGIAYAAQEAWVLNDSIRNNILFGSEYDEDRYKEVLSQCALDKDMELFDAGDQTEVGEKGLTLRQARVSLARAVYSRAEIVLLDDILSALDVHTSRWIVENCLRGDLVTDRTIIIVTHNVAMIGEIADFVVSLGNNGQVINQGHVSEVLRVNARFRAEVEQEKEVEEKAAQATNEMDSEREKPVNAGGDGKLMVQEEVVVGHVGWPALKLFLLSFGGLRFWIFCLGAFMLSDAVLTLQSYWVGVWARAYNAHPGHPEQVNATMYLVVYIAICFGGVCLYAGAYILHILGSVRAARRIHEQLMASILGAPLRWLDSTPIGRIVARFTQDIRSVDETLPLQLESIFSTSFNMCSSFLVIVIFSPQFTIPGIAILVGGIWIGQIYIQSQLSIKREMSNTRSPLFSHFGTALAGITSIRAYGVQEHFKNEAMERVDKYTRAARTFYNLNRWISFRMNALGGVFAAGLAAYLVYGGSSPDASNTGFSLNRAVMLSSGVFWWVRILNEFEVQGNSLERIKSYIAIEQEAAPVPEKVPPAHWPSSGNIIVENLSARYSSNSPIVLHGLSFEVKSGERIGIVGRTGSGKSSLTLSLLRMIPTEGNIYYDGIPTHALNLDALRTNITIIPQQPELMSGTVRQNLDPFDEYDDAFLNAALHSAGLESIQPEDPQDRIGLDSGVSAGGSNFSLGQRQILALARAIVRRSKILILDEATAAIDHNADTAIQSSIRTELHGMTLIIVAHRLQTICDADKIMVLDSGRIVEFDSPAILLRKQNGAFKSLVDESGDKDYLYAMANGQRK
ncbi:P-loop containing nucleoside triphosphate hydrolase protein [Rhizoctonia solani]|uniref:P-loop containing nucleoside triphosphate hydrolase protein n=1 Tax=Rhizoctonia solani TaxID=456999 RepID=A0A8H7LEB7_9AGAM|nr:P-loop containing nucleoside triphosphate hydrolase protein [Rhizoctonia solani]